MILRGPNVQLIPYSKENWQVLAGWFYDKAYRPLFRQHIKALGQVDFENWPQLVGGDVFLIFDNSTQQIAGLTYIVPDHKPNRAFYTALLIDKKFQGKRYTNETLILLYNHAFNSLGYRKGVVEILESNASLMKTLEAAGFCFEGILKEECFLDGKFENEARYYMFDNYYNRHFRNIAQEWENKTEALMTKAA